VFHGKPPFSTPVAPLRDWRSWGIVAASQGILRGMLNTLLWWLGVIFAGDLLWTLFVWAPFLRPIRRQHLCPTCGQWLTNDVTRTTWRRAWHR